MRRNFRVGICAAVLTAVTVMACIAQGQGQGLGSNANRSSWIADSQDEFDMKLGMFVRVGDFGSILVMSQTQPWWTKAHPELYAAVHSPSGTVSNAGGGGGGGTGGGRGQQKTFMLSEMVFAPRGSSPQSPYFIATLSWEEGTELPEDNMLDYFGKVSLDMPWEHLNSYPFSHWHPTNLWGRIFIDIWEPKWAKSGFFTVAPHKDTDNDGVSDAVEILIHGTDPYGTSSAGDGMTDKWKQRYGLDPNVWLDPNADPDNDGLTNFQEYLNNTDPFNPDTDGDGYTDGWEVANGTNPLDPDDPGAAGPPAGNDDKDVAFTLGGDYAQWEMTVRGITPGGDARTLKINMQAPGYTQGTTLKLRKGNAYRITLRWIKTLAGQSQEWYCWQAQADGLPKTNTYVSYNPSRIPGAATTVSANGWFMDNAGGLFTDHVHMSANSGGNVAGKLKATLYVPKAAVSEVCFHDHTVVKKDDGTDFPSAYHWKGNTVTTGVGDESNPVAYPRNTSPKISVKIKVTPETFLYGNDSKIRVRATGPNGIAFPATGPAAFAAGVVRVDATVCTGQLPATIKYYDKTGNEAAPFQLDWQVSFDSGSTWQSVGDTKHTVYVTAAASGGVWRQETLFYHGCKYADGVDNTLTMISSIWQPFSSTVRNVKRVDGTQLTYYNSYIVNSRSTPSLLAQGDGQCGAWARLFLDILLVQGFRQSNNLATIEASTTGVDHGFIVKNWTFSGSGTSGSGTHPYINRVSAVGQNPPAYAGVNGYIWVGTPEVTYTSGTPGQGNAMPAALFGNHALAVVNGVFYDPSYGVTYPNLQGFDNALDGFFQVQAAWPVSGGTSPALLFRKNLAGGNVQEHKDGRENYGAPN